MWRDDGTGEVQVGAYGYDVLGRRVARETWSLDGSGLSERVLWDGDVPAERNRAERGPLAGAPVHAGPAASGGVAVRTYAFQGFEPVAVLDGDDGAAVVECDQVGQPRLAVDRAGALVWEGQFDAWGGEVAVTGELAVEARFPGQVADEESGLRYNRFRYYDAKHCRVYTRPRPELGLQGGARHPWVCRKRPTRWVWTHIGSR